MIRILLEIVYSCGVGLLRINNRFCFFCQVIGGYYVVVQLVVLVADVLPLGGHVVTQTNGDKEACWQGRTMMTSKGPVVVESLKQAKVM